MKTFVKFIGTLFNLGAHGLAGESGAVEGVLVRKHDWESTTKKASNRSWDKVKPTLVSQRVLCILMNVFFIFQTPGLCCRQEFSSNILQGPKSIEIITRINVPW